LAPFFGSFAVAGLTFARLCGVAACAAALIAGEARAQEPAAVARGARLAAEICAPCHDVGERGAGRGVAPEGKSRAGPSFREVAGAPGMNQRALAVFLRTPHASMPDIILAPDEIEALGAFIMSR
jgi:mono/diheme cytochrome c family protein